MFDQRLQRHLRRCLHSGPLQIWRFLQASASMKSYVPSGCHLQGGVALALLPTRLLKDGAAIVVSIHHVHIQSVAHWWWLPVALEAHQWDSTSQKRDDSVVSSYRRVAIFLHLSENLEMIAHRQVIIQEFKLLSDFQSTYRRATKLKRLPQGLLRSYRRHLKWKIRFAGYATPHCGIRHDRPQHPAAPSRDTIWLPRRATSEDALIPRWPNQV